ncbi:MAG: hypothetical protein JW909_09695 [Planctomycetes bacterium]|nr:hypothetical protein [Planctomycetota bacterium]
MDGGGVFGYTRNRILPYVAGAPLAGTGLVFIFFALNESQGHGTAAMLATGIAVALAGAALLTFRSRIEFDTAKKTWRVLRGFVVMLTVKRGGFDELESISVAREVKTQSSEDGYTAQEYVTYPIEITLPGGKEWRVRTASDEFEARQIAKRVARSARVVFLDLIDGSARYAPEDLDVSIKDRFRNLKGGPPKIPSDLPDRRSACAVEGAGVTFVIPPPGAKPVVFGGFMLLLGLAMGGYLSCAVLTGTGVPAAAMIFALVFGAGMLGLVPFIVGLFFIVDGVLGITVVEASPESVTTRRRTLLGWKVMTSPAERVEDIVVPRKGDTYGPVIILAETGVMKFGGHLGDTEKTWIRRVLGIVLAS